MNSKLKEILFKPIGGVIFNRVIGKLKKIVWSLIVIVILTSSVVTIYIGYTFLNGENGDESLSEVAIDENNQNVLDENCNVAGINLHGHLVTYISQEEKDTTGENKSDSTASEAILGTIKSAEEDKNIKAIILEVDSYGGVPVAGEEVMAALKNSTKPTVAFIRSAGASAAYMAASGAQTVFASQFSDVGSIGVTISYLDSVAKNNKDGFNFNQLSVGKYKDMGNPDKPLTSEEKTLTMRDLNIIQENFIKIVSENRKIDINKVKKMADGSTMLGQMALENKLVDKIGNYFDVLNFVSSTINIKPEVCWY